MLRHKDQELEWLEFEILAGQPELKHAIFLRHGGVSEGPFASLNIGGGTGDNPRHIARNRQKIQKALGVGLLVSGKQVHGSEIALVHPGASARECDALVTQEPNIGLMIKHADCQAAIFYDPLTHAVANVHSGWRGSVQNIYAKTVDFMRKTFGTKPQNLLVGISPSLGPENAEFINYRTELPEPLWSFQTRPAHFDFWQISRSQLLHTGVLSHHIEIAQLCTFAEKQDFFSYRRDKITGRHATVVFLKK